MKKQDTIELLQKQLPGFYSVDQVIELINGIEEGSSNKLSMESMQVLKRNLLHLITNKLEDLSSSEVFDFFSAEFELSNGNQIELCSIELTPAAYDEAVSDGIDEVIHDFFEPLEN
jgi:hypothetical protein